MSPPVTARRLLFYCDTISPYAYFCAHALPAVAAKHAAVVDLQPVLFAGLLNASGGMGPAEVPLKRKYMFLDCLRLAKQQGLPFVGPPRHPYNPLLALRSACLVDDNAQRFSYVKGLLSACWGQGKDISDPIVVSEVATVCGLPADLANRAQSEEAKRRLRDSTERAVARGVFGVPTVIEGTQLFWGSDRLHHLEAHLSGTLAVDYNRLDAILSVPRGSDRKAFRSGTSEK